MAPNEAIAKVWEVMEAPLEKHDLPWANQELLAKAHNRQNAIKVIAHTDGRVTVQVNTETLAYDSANGMEALCDIEETIKQKFSGVATSFMFDFAFFEFKVD